MKAIIAAKGQLNDVEIDAPEPAAYDLLVEVKAISVNPVDVKVLTRAKDGGDRKILGFDAVGVVQALGAKVNGFAVGDRVWYAGDVTRPGSNAELQCVDSRITSHAPKQLTDAQAAALPLTGITAWELLFDRLQMPVDDEKRVLLIIGGAGGVGSMLIQLAKALTKATVVATASRDESKAWCKELGADYVLDHSEPLGAELAASGLRDVTDVASLTHTDEYYEEVVGFMRPQGRFALIDDPVKGLDISLMKQKSISLHWEFMFTRPMFKTSDLARQGEILAELAKLADSGQVRSSLSQTLTPLNAATLIKAHEMISTQRTVGKIAVTKE